MITWYVFHCPKCKWKNGIRKDRCEMAEIECLNCGMCISLTPSSRFFGEKPLLKRVGIRNSCERWALSEDKLSWSWEGDLGDGDIFS